MLAKMSHAVEYISDLWLDHVTFPPPSQTPTLRNPPPFLSELLQPFSKKPVSLPPTPVSSSGFSMPQPELALRNINLSFHLQQKSNQFNKSQLSSYHLPGTVLGAECVLVTKTDLEPPLMELMVGWRGQMMASRCLGARLKFLNIV